MTFGEIVQIISSVVGSAGGLLGFVSFFKTRKNEKEMWKTFIWFQRVRESIPTASRVDLTIGTEVHKMAEKLVEKGLLKRSDFSLEKGLIGYELP